MEFIEKFINKKVAFSGHRPDKINNNHVFNLLTEICLLIQPKLVIQGMAAGVDLLVAKAAFKCNIPYDCYIPWAGHQPQQNWVNAYNNAKAHANNIKILDNKIDYPGPWIYQKRNQAMVDDSDCLIAIWDGSNGGTKNCVDYAKNAKQKGKAVLIVPPTCENFIQMISGYVDNTLH